jgi:hypothetical protein
LFNYAATALAVINSFQSRFFSVLPPSDLSTKLFTVNKNVASGYYIEPITDSALAVGDLNVLPFQHVASTEFV